MKTAAENFEMSGWLRAAVVCVLLSCGYPGNYWLSAETPGRFRVTVDDGGKYWFVDPQGRRFLSLGINNIIAQPFRPRPNTQYYQPIPDPCSSYAEWKKDVFETLGEHGFNTLGCWSDGRLYDGPAYGTICLYVVGHASDRCLDGLRPGLEERIRENVEAMLETYPYQDTILGVFLDNEMPWYGHGAWGDIPNYTLLELAMSLPAEDAARRAAVKFLQQRYASAKALSAAWGKPLSSWQALSFEYVRGCVSPQAHEDRLEFIRSAAEAFYKTAAATVRQMLPGTLILGTRFAAYAPEPVIRECGRYCDVVSFNDYRPSPLADSDMLSKYWIWGGKKPLMVTEFAWRGEENTSGNPNSGGAGAVVKTQAQRGENYQRYVEDLLSYPMVIGAHWFEFADQSPQGRFDGENSNYGVVDIYHRPYPALLTAMRQANARVEELHAQSSRRVPDSLPTPRAVVFEPGQRPDRPPVVDLLKAPVRGAETFQAPDAAIDLKQKSDVLTISITTGNDWGCGVIFFGPKAFENTAADSITNLDGYSAIELDATIDPAFTFDLFLDEAGVAAANAVSYDMSAGNDAESFVIPANQGRSGRSVYRFDLNTLQARRDYGNQKGLRKVDMHAIKGIALFFHGGQGAGRIHLFSMKLVR